MQSPDPEETFIRNLVLLASTGAAAGLLAVGTIVTILVSANFNILNWME